MLLKKKILIIPCFFILLISSLLRSQTFFPADPYFLINYEKKQFDGFFPFNSNIFRPFFLSELDSTTYNIAYKSEFYFNNNAPNQENMDMRYSSKGISYFTSLQFSLNHKYLSLLFEPFLKENNFYKFNEINRYGTFNNLNDRQIDPNFDKSNIRNFLSFINYKGFGIGFHKGNRWWGPGIHSSIQMTNNTWPQPSQIIGTIKEIRIGNFGFMGFHSFSQINNSYKEFGKYHTALNGQLSWYGSLHLSLGFSRNYLSGGVLSYNGRVWTEKDAKLLVFENFLTSNLLKYDYTIGGHDLWDQTLSTYLSIVLPKRKIKLYAEIGIDDNRMYFADFLSQPDHTMATILGFRDYGLGDKNIVYGFEWTNMMITYTIRHRGVGGTPTWYSKPLYDYSSYNGRRWGAHSGSDSDDWLIYFGYISNKLYLMPSFNYERHGVVSNRPAEVKIECRLDIRFNFKNSWFGIYYENQNEMFLGFPDYFYEDKFGNPVDSSSGKLANSRKTGTLFLSFNKNFNL